MTVITPTDPFVARGTFSAALCAHTAPLQQEFFQIAFVRAAVRGELDRPAYLAFLEQAYHHVKHTVPLLVATRDRLGERHAWLREGLEHYIVEETGHDAWILDDIEACGGDAEAVAHGRPALPCELLVAYAWDTVMRCNPLGFFSMAHVLEGVSARGASGAAEAIRLRLGLPAGAVRYLSSHGELDQDHQRFFNGLMDRLDDPEQQRDLLHRASVFYRLYGDVFRALPTGVAS
jgi:hypothetical protein